MEKCKICGIDCKSNISLVKHLKYTHNIESKEYYDKYLKEKDEGICKSCGKLTKYINISSGYAKYCSTNCSKAWDTRHSNYEKFELKNNCTQKVKLENKYGKHMLDGIPQIKYENSYFISNKYIKEIKNKYTNCKYICKICNQAFKSSSSLGNHIKLSHNILSEDYYNQFLRKNEKEGICVSCGKPTRFCGLDKGYNKHCSHECNNKDVEFRKRVSETIKSEEWQTKNKQRMLDKFGVDSFSKTNEFKDKFRKTFNSNVEKFEKENDCTLLWKLIEEYGQGWYTKGIGKRIKNGWNIFIPNSDIETIQKYSKENHQSTFEVDIVEYIKSIYSDKIINGDRKCIKPQELDIYMPNKNLAIEVNGVHWHSTNCGMPKNYHLDKTKKCEDLGIRLIHIFDIEWITKKEICKSLIASALDIYKNKIYARNCEIKEVDSGLVKQFLENNHIQGNINSSYKLGLFYKDELVQLICIGKSRFKKDEYELLRMCTKLNTQVVGGFSKLMAHQPYTNLISYVDRSKFTGAGYLNNGWLLLSETPPSYFYWRRDIGKLNRVQCQKHKLPKLLGDNFDINKTEKENMINNNFYQVYDCGNFKMIFNKENIK